MTEREPSIPPAEKASPTSGKPSAASSGPSGNWIWLGLLVSIFTLFGVMAIGIHRRNQPPRLPVLGTIPRFSLVDQHAQPVRDDTMRGKVWIADFIFLGCQASCPKLTGRMAGLQDRIEAKQSGIQLVSISVDPENDTPQKLAEYAAKWKAHDARWTFLSGKSAELDRIVVQGFKMQYGKVDEGAGVFGIMHGDWFVLVDAEGAIRGFYDSDEPGQLDRLMHDADQLGASRSKS
ncbi:MAG: hypothetical protein NVS3B20_04500 [Polyangiales bacterium]